MSDKIPVVSGAKMVKFLETLGFRQLGQKGSHIIVSKEGGNEFVVPKHKELKKGTMTAILRQAKISREEFIRAMRSN